jgi:hypothetical protein
MGIETLTDDKITQLLACPKRVENPLAREKQENKHLRRDFKVVSEDNEHRFTLFTRQSTKITDGFSAGLLWHAKSGDDVMLMRCNGSDHPHPNKLEREHISYKCHVHTATERYILANRKTEGYAEETQAYQTLVGALHYLVSKANIQGLKTEADKTKQQPDLFKDKP